MKTGDLVRQFGVSARTVNNWVEVFSDFMSDGAKKIGTKQSIYNADDFIVLATINELSNQGMNYDTIRRRLSEGFRVDEKFAQTVGYDDGRMVPAAAVEQIIDATEVRIELEQVRAERDKLAQMLYDSQGQLRSLQERLNLLEAERREEIATLETQRREEIARLKDQIAELQRELGRAEGELHYRRQIDDNRRNDHD